MAGNLSFEALTEAVALGEIDTVVVAFPDMQGRLVGKRFHAQYFVDGGFEETHGCNYLLANDLEMELVPGYAATNWAAGYGDYVWKPDLSTLCRTPWQPGAALVLCDVEDHHHHPIPHSPRAMLRAQIDRLAAMGMRAAMASELEFYLFDETYATLRDRRYTVPRSSGSYIQDYHIFQTAKEEPVMRAMRNQLQGAGIPVENSKGEWGPGQCEMNVRYADPLTMADRHVIMKEAMKEIAHTTGKSITFLSKWRDDLAGSSCHVHLSLWSLDGRALFPDASDAFGMSPLMRQFLAGQIKYAPDMTLFLAPYVNSYKRFQGASFAPTKLVWSRDNRTAGFRLVGEGTKGVRTECRVGGADLNPYLAFAGLIAAGIAGIEENLDPGAPFIGDAYLEGSLRDIPRTLRDAIAAMEGSALMRASFGDAVIEHYLHAARWEQSEADRRVTDWDLMRGFERV